MRRLILIVSSLALALPSARAQTTDAAQLDRYAREAQRELAERRYDDAAVAYEKLRDLSPRTAEVHAQLGAVYFQQHAFAKAVPSLRRALELKADLPNVDVLLALCRSELGHFKEAVPGLLKAFNQESFSRDNVRVLTSVNYDKMSAEDRAKEPNPRSDRDYALSWVRREGKGRLFYEAHGHHERTYAITPFLEHILAGVQYAIGDLKADDTPVKSGSR